jgi:hypothetical protein
MNHVKSLFTIIAVAAFQVSAETAYRSVDEQGNVTFSDQPVSGAAQEEQVTIDAPAPTAERQQDARRREAELQKAASQAGASRVPARDARQETARQTLRDAEKGLEDARRVREGDRIGTAGGGNRLKPEYHERVRKAEAEVERARKQAGAER